MKNLNNLFRSVIQRGISLLIIFFFTLNLIIPPSYAQSVLNLPTPGSLVNMTTAFSPVIMRGITIHPEDALKFDFLIEKGDEGLNDEDFKNEANKLIKYFLAALTISEKEMWVNLSPYEKDRIIPQNFGQTEMGRDLLAQDYLLKQLTASLMVPENDLGIEFWNRVHQKAKERFGADELPMNTFNKIWIVPEKAFVYEHEKGAVVVKNHLKVMLEEDYLALDANKNSTEHGLGNVQKENLKVISGVQSQVIKEILIPEIEKEVNEGKTFANLRQIFNSVILATWYKQALKESLLGQVYVNQNKLKGVESDDKEINQKIYNQYVEAFKKGVYDLVKEEYDAESQTVIPRKYFSGGVKTEVEVEKASSEVANQAMNGEVVRFETDLKAEGADAAMTAEEVYTDLNRYGTRSKTRIGVAVAGENLILSLEEIRQGFDAKVIVAEKKIKSGGSVLVEYAIKDPTAINAIKRLGELAERGDESVRVEAEGTGYEVSLDDIYGLFVAAKVDYDSTSRVFKEKQSNQQPNSVEQGKASAQTEKVEAEKVYADLIRGGRSSKSRIDVDVAGTNFLLSPEEIREGFDAKVIVAEEKVKSGGSVAIEYAIKDPTVLNAIQELNVLAERGDETVRVEAEGTGYNVGINDIYGLVAVGKVVYDSPSRVFREKRSNQQTNPVGAESLTAIQPKKKEVTSEETLHLYWESLAANKIRNNKHFDNLKQFSEGERVSVGSLIRALIHFTQFEKGTVTDSKDLEGLLEESGSFAYKIYSNVTRFNDAYYYSEKITLLQLQVSIDKVLLALKDQRNKSNVIQRISQSPISEPLVPAVKEDAAMTAEEIKQQLTLTSKVFAGFDFAEHPDWDMVGMGEEAINNSIIPEFKFSSQSLEGVRQLRERNPEALIAVGEIENVDQAKQAIDAGASVLVASILLSEDDIIAIRNYKSDAVFVVSGAENRDQIQSLAERRGDARPDGIKLKPFARSPEMLVGNLNLLREMKLKFPDIFFGGAGGVKASNVVSARENGAFFVGSGIDSTDDIRRLALAIEKSSNAAMMADGGMMSEEQLRSRLEDLPIFETVEMAALQAGVYDKFVKYGEIKEKSEIDEMTKWATFLESRAYKVVKIPLKQLFEKDKELFGELVLKTAFRKNNRSVFANDKDKENKLKQYGLLHPDTGELLDSIIALVESFVEFESGNLDAVNAEESSSKDSPKTQPATSSQGNSSPLYSFPSKDNLWQVGEKLKVTKKDGSVVEGSFVRLDYPDPRFAQMIKIKVDGKEVIILKVNIQSVERATLAKGGIDLNPTIMNMETQKNGNGVIVPIPLQPIESFKNLQGMTPNIIGVSPAMSLRLLLGMTGDNDQPKPERTDVSMNLSMLPADQRERYALKEE